MTQAITSAAVGRAREAAPVDVETAPRQRVHLVPVERLRSAFPVRTRAIDLDHVRALARASDRHEPIVVHRSTMRVIDGVHRLCAVVATGRRAVAVEYFDGTEADAFVLAVRLNVRHGSPLTLDDRKRAAVRILLSYPHWSDRAIARCTGLHAKTIGRLRNRTGDEMTKSTTRLGRDGRTRPASNEQARRRAVAALTGDPDAPLRELARRAGVSVGTVREVRDRLVRGEDPVTRRRRDVGSRPATVSRDPKQQLARLTRDPALRATEPGRRLLRMLMVTQLDEIEWERLLAAVPAHCVSLVVGVVHGRVDEWQRFAAMVAQSARDDVTRPA